MKIKLEIENDYGLFKANNNEEPDRLKIYDSDGQYMEYIDVSDVITEGMDDLYFATTNKDAHYVAFRLARLLYNQGAEIVGVVDNADFGHLYELYGEEFVNRIGNCALVFKEV
jgi:hypothetical protein